MVVKRDNFLDKLIVYGIKLTQFLGVIMLGLGRRKKNGWLAVGFFADRIDVAHVERPKAGYPRLMRLESWARSADDASALALLRQKGLAAYQCTTLLDAQSYQMATLEAPDLPVGEWREALRWRLKDILAFPAEAATIDYLNLPVGQMAGRPQNIIAVAGDNARLAPRIRAFDKAKFDLQAVDIPELAQRNIAALFEDENRGLAMLAFDSTGGLLTFTYGGELCVSRRIEITLPQLAMADDEARTALHERIGLELQRSLDNFERQYTMISVSKVVLAQNSVVGSLQAALRDLVYVPVEIGDLTSVIDCAAIPELREADLQAERLSIIGAALRQESTKGQE